MKKEIRRVENEKMRTFSRNAYDPGKDFKEDSDFPEPKPIYWKKNEDTEDYDWIGEDCVVEAERIYRVYTIYPILPTPPPSWSGVDIGLLEDLTVNSNSSGDDVVEQQKKKEEEKKKNERENKAKELAKKLESAIAKCLEGIDDPFIQKVYSKREALLSKVNYAHDEGGGGNYKDGQINVGRLGFDTDASDDDILGTIFHEYVHYIADEYSIYPKRYGNNGIYNESFVNYRILSPNEFMQEVYDRFMDKLIDRTSGVGAELDDYPDLYIDLNETQKKDVQVFMDKEGYDIRQEYIIPYRYTPSNHSRDEINAHERTLSISQSNCVFKFSEDKELSYRKEIEKWKNTLILNIEYERQNSYNAAGYKINK